MNRKDNVMFIKSKKFIAAAVSAAVVLSSAGIAYAANNVKEEKSAESAAVTNITAEKNEQKPEKDETVYAFINADGGVNKIIVSDWLKNTLAENEIADYSELSGIENVKGNESFSGNGDMTWSAGGNDIYYSGTSEKALPVDVEITYLLDGNEIQPSELLGKSGRVTIRWKFTGNQYETRKIDGAEKKIYVPFAAVTGMLLDNDIFTNVETENCRLINDGDRSAVVGIAFAGLSENLELDGEKIQIPDSFEISADVENFSISNTFTIVTNEIFNNIEIDGFDDLSDLTGATTQLTDAMERLISGSGELSDGLAALANGSAELAEGVSALTVGSASLSEGSLTLYSGAAELSAGIDSLGGGLEQLDQNSAALNAGAKQVFESLLASATEQLTAAGVPVPALTIDNYAQTLDGVVAQLGNDKSTEQARGSIAALKAQLDSYNEFYVGLTAYTSGVASANAGVKQLEAGAKTLEAGAKTLSDGAAQLDGGLKTLNESVPSLKNGAEQLRDGAKELNEGIIKLNDEGISKLIDAVDGDIEGLLERIQLTSEVSSNYRTFAGLPNDTDGQVRFIYRTEAIE